MKKADFVTEPLEGSPFMIVNGEEGWNLAMGRYRIWEEFCTTKEELLERLDECRWEVITKLCGIIFEMRLSNDFKIGEKP